MNQIYSNLFIQCPREQRAKLKNVSVKLQVSESALVRAALREGLKIVLKRGIRLDGAGSEEGDAKRRAEGERQHA